MPTRPAKNIPRLSVIMPVYNEAEHIAFALESVLMQDVDFSYEIIVVDDCSTDDTAAIVASYQEKFPHIRYHKNSENKGNGYSFWQALSLSRGDFFQVLDGDDFLIRRDKLQRQVDFLSDNPGYAAVAANSLRLIHKGCFYPEVKPGQGDRSYEYADVLRLKFYFHTSSYMYRNVYRSKVPLFLKEDWARGDGIRTIMHAAHGKIKFLDFIGSVYRYNNQGIWSSLTAEQRNNRTLHAFKKIREVVLQKDWEKHIFSQTIRFYENYRSRSKIIILLLMLRTPVHTFRKLFQRDALGKLVRFLFPLPSVTNPQKALLTLQDYLARVSYSKKTRAKVFAHCYAAKEADQLCEAVGKLYLDSINFLWRDRKYDMGHIVIMVGGLNRKGGGVYREICDLIEIHRTQGHTITVLSSERVPTPPDVIAYITNSSGVAFENAPPGLPISLKMEWLINRLVELSPGRLYPFPSHDDVAMAATVQAGLASQTVLDFCIDHGISLLLTNSTVQAFILKVPYHYFMLGNVVPQSRLHYIPIFMEDLKHKPVYKPLASGGLTTLTASARSYKLNDYVYAYPQVIAQALACTTGRHMHIGPLTAEQQRHIAAEMKKHGVPASRFIHVPWVESLTHFAAEYHVDAYIQPFPIGAGRTSIEMMRAGIPVINHYHQTQPMFRAAAYCHPLALEWATPKQLFGILKSLDMPTLRKLSKDARSFYETHNSFQNTIERINKLQGFNPPQPEQYRNIELKDIAAGFPDTLRHRMNLQHFGKQGLKALFQQLGFLEWARGRAS